MYEADGGRILYCPESADTPVDVQGLRKEGLKAYRQKVRYVFQDPARSLNPRMSVYDVLVSGLRWSGLESKTRAREKLFRQRAEAALDEVGLSPGDLDRRPSEFSGGQRQRISIARGLLMQPRLLICDEVVSALDVSIQGQILNLLLDIREKRDISFLFIAHDLKVACYFCDRIGVMYRGELMEEAPAAELWKNGLHPYTKLLFSSVENRTEGNSPPGQGVASARPNAGCAFSQRCAQATERCFREKPETRELEAGHLIRCFEF
jgi:oligopeptide/dipeptide ABC transporter ATP-binding protein